MPKRLLILVISMAFLCACVERTFVFYPSKYPAGNWQPQNLDIEDAWFTTTDGVKLHAWYAAAVQPRGYLLFAHGNAGNLSDRAEVVRLLNQQLGLSVLIFDYRGYGRSEGEPSVRGLKLDAHAAHQWLRERANIEAQQIVLLGRSIGTLVMVQLAAEHGARALVLESAFPSLADVGAHAYPWLPVRTLLRHDINAHELIKHYHGPLLQSHGTADSLVPLKLGRQLFHSANEPKQWLELPDHGHNDPQPAQYYQKLNHFLEQAAAVSTP